MQILYLLVLRLLISQRKKENSRPLIFIFFFCRYRNCHVSIEMPTCISLLSIYKFSIKCMYRYWPWTWLLSVQLSFAFVFNACSGTVIEIEMSKINATFVASVGTEILAESCLRLCCSHLQNWLYARHGFCFNSCVREKACGWRASGFKTEFDDCVISIGFFRAISLSSCWSIVSSYWLIFTSCCIIAFRFNWENEVAIVWKAS